ncbi:HNH endonuclease [Gottfriedia luciferensis]|uniref:HNH endonuclease n=1 Tax=Gottfriedia luciferensis TaxID=178774 RepID=UPI001F3E589E|nr:HNH endonuclease signature motif containing protein [Gottfriedia luciferensis]
MIGHKELIATLRKKYPKRVFSTYVLKRMVESGMPIHSSGNYDLAEVEQWIENKQSEIDSLEIGSVFTNNDLVQIFAISNQGGMRRSHVTNTLVIFSDHTKMYDDKWYNNILHYTGMGQNDDQDINFGQNKTLLESNINGVNVYLFESYKSRNYTFVGQVKLVADPYQATQKGQDKSERLVWIFPVQPMADQFIKKVIIDENQKDKEAEAAKLSMEELKNKAKEASQKPSSRTTSSTTYERDPYIAEFTKRRANGTCDLCNQPAPFKNKMGEPYLESHHIEWLSKGGEDSIENTVALCPNCHKKMHIVNEQSDVSLLQKKYGSIKL